MDVSTLLNELGAAVADAKAKADVVTRQKTELAEIVADRQAAIDEAEQAYQDAKIAVDRLQAQGREVIDAILPAQDHRFRVSR